MESDPLLAFITSEFYNSFSWFIEYGTNDIMNAIIINPSCHQGFRLEVASYLREINDLDKEALQTVLLSNELKNEDAILYLSYGSKQQFLLTMQVLQKFIQLLGTSNDEQYLQFGSEYANEFIRAAQSGGNAELAINIAKGMQHMQEMDLNVNGFEGLLFALKESDADSSDMWELLSPYILSNSNKDFISQTSFQTTQTVVKLVKQYKPQLCVTLCRQVLQSTILISEQVRLLFPMITSLITESQGQNQQELEFSVNSILERAIETDFQKKFVSEGVQRILKLHPNWLFFQGYPSRLILSLFTDQNINEVNLLLQNQGIVKQLSLEERTKLLEVAVENSQFMEKEFENTWKELLATSLNIGMNNKGGLVCRIVELILKRSFDTSFAQQLLSEKFDGDVVDMVDMVKMLDVICAQDRQIELPIGVLQFLESNYEQLLDQMSPSTIEYCALCAAGVCDQATLEFYSYLHSKYKHEVSPKVWKAALISAKDLQNWQVGYKTLNHIPEDRRKKEVDWKLDTEQLKECEILIMLYGQDSLDDSWSLVERFSKEFGHIPQYPVQKLLERVLEASNPYQSSIFVQKVLLFIKQTNTVGVDLQLLVTLSELVVLCDQSIQKIEVAAYLLLLYFNNIYKVNNLAVKNLVMQFFWQCSLCGPTLLPVLVYLSLATMDYVSDELLTSLEADENAQAWLQETYTNKEVIDLILYTPSEDLVHTKELTKHYGTKRSKERVLSYLQTLQGRISLKNIVEIDEFQQDDDRSWEGYNEASWLVQLTQDPQWKMWPLAKLQSCAKKLRGKGNLKKYKLQKDLVSFIEKTRDQILRST
eukprot:TRINITY_DN5153_c0_g1_i8.p1 TRINITY_DN5153_c0_g1~~TRINITY_DN5153_c0_g1_i8.p1  ORF type:complete len:880 (-),score=92.12 TRINITY_DN5153_c0_g1_i8:593-3052(-)